LLAFPGNAIDPIGDGTKASDPVVNEINSYYVHLPCLGTKQHFLKKTKKRTANGTKASYIPCALIELAAC
jgi:hypothetical protein